MGLPHKGEADYINEKWQEYSGYTLAETTTRGWASFLHPEDSEAAQQTWERAIETGEPFEISHRLLRKDGVYRWFLSRAVPLKDTEGQVQRWLGVFTDIDAQKRSEETQRFLADLATNLGSLTDPEAMIRTTVTALGKHLHVANCSFIEVDVQLDQFTIHPDYHHRMPSTAGTYPLSIFGNKLLEGIKQGHPIILTDTQTDPRTAEIYETLYKPIPIRASASCPIKRNGEWVATLRIAEAEQPRYWTDDEINLLNNVSEHLWLALENVRLYREAQQEIAVRKRHEEQIKQQVDRLAALRSIDSVITASLDLRLTLQFFLDQVLYLMEVDAATVLLYHSESHMLECTATKGSQWIHKEHRTQHISAGQAGQTVLRRQINFVPNVPQALTTFIHPEVLVREGIQSYVSIPLLTKGNVVGVLEVFHRTTLRPDPDWLEFLQTLAGQAAIAIENATLFENLQRSNLELSLAYDSTIEGWSRAMDLRDHETEGHSQRVTAMTIKLAHALGFSEKELVHVRRGALLHDIGKMGIPDGILLKEGSLTPEEWEIMRKHTQYAYDMLLPIAFLREAIDIPYCHHEKWDGSGYPRALKGAAIPLAARIFAVADIWDALSSNRSYRKAWQEDDICAYIQSISGTHLDPMVVDIFFRLKNTGEI